MDILLTLYVKVKIIERNIIHTLRAWSFCYFIIHNKVFGRGSPIWILKILQLFLSFECSEYSDKIIMNRTKYESAALFSSLVNEYEKNKSQVVLNQLVSILKTDFLERDNGRK